MSVAYRACKVKGKALGNSKMSAAFAILVHCRDGGTTWDSWDMSPPFVTLVLLLICFGELKWVPSEKLFLNQFVPAHFL